MNMKIFLKPAFIKSKPSAQALAVGCALRNSLCDSNAPIIYTSIDSWMFALTGCIRCSARFKEALLFGFDELVKNGYIKILEKKKESYILDFSAMILGPDDENYVLIDPQDVKTIFNMNGVQIFQILKYYIFLVSTMTVSFGMPNDRYCKSPVYVSNMAGSVLSDMADISYRTVLVYNEVLENSKLIYIYRGHVFSVTKDGESYKIPNIYGRYKDKEWIEAQAPRFLNAKKHGEIYNYKN